MHSLSQSGHAIGQPDDRTQFQHILVDFGFVLKQRLGESLNKSAANEGENNDLVMVVKSFVLRCFDILWQIDDSFSDCINSNHISINRRQEGCEWFQLIAKLVLQRLVIVNLVNQHVHFDIQSVDEVYGFLKTFSA